MKVHRNRFPMGSFPGQKTDGYYMDLTHQYNLDDLMAGIKKNQDIIIIYTGDAGTGKTTMAMQDLLYMDPTFNLSRVCFSPDQTHSVITKATQGQAVLIDEAIIYSSRSSLTSESKKMQLIINQMRSKGLIVAFCIPSVFELDKTIVFSRCKMLVHLYFRKYAQRGTYNCYINAEAEKIDRIKEVYKNYSASRTLGKGTKPPPNYSGGFGPLFAIDKDAYEKKKAKTFKSMLKTKSNVNLKVMAQRNSLIRYISKLDDINHRDISNIDPTLSLAVVNKVVAKLKNQEMLKELAKENEF